MENLNTGDDITQEEINALRKVQPGTLFAKFASTGTILPFGAFMSYVRDRSVEDTLSSGFYKAACSCGGGMLGDMFSKILSSGGSCGGMNISDADSMFGAAPKAMVMADDGATDDVQKLMDSVSKRHDD